jgi:site-specific DNA recombinase
MIIVFPTFRPSSSSAGTDDLHHRRASSIRPHYALQIKSTARPIDCSLARSRSHRRASPSTLKSGKTVGGIAFTRGPLAHLLRSRFYIGEVAFKGEVLRGEQEAILDRNLFEAVQAKLDEQANSHKKTRTRSETLLTGRIFDDVGNRMSPTHARKAGVKYRYYLSSALLNGAAQRAGSVARVPAAEVEAVVVKSVREHFRSQRAIDDRTLIETHVVRTEVHTDHLIVKLVQAEAEDDDTRPETVLFGAMAENGSTRRREILIPEGTSPQANAPHTVRESSHPRWQRFICKWLPVRKSRRPYRSY